MADVTISSLPVGTPSGNVVIPYSNGSNTYTARPSAIVNASIVTGTYTPQLYMWQYTVQNGYYNFREVLPYSGGGNASETTGNFTKIGNMLYVSWQWINRTGGGSSVPQDPSEGAPSGTQAGWMMKLPNNITNNITGTLNTAGYSLPFIPGGYTAMNSLGNSDTILPHRWQSNLPGYLVLYGQLSRTAWTSSTLNFSAAGWIPLSSP